MWQIFQPSWVTARTPPQRGHCAELQVVPIVLTATPIPVLTDGYPRIRP